MAEDDETKLKLHQYTVQIITIEENKKLIEKLRNEVGEFKTKFGLKSEAFERLKKATDGHEEKMAEAQDQIQAQKQKIKQLQTDLDLSGYGDSKQKSTVSLLHQNVATLESNIRTKDFEI